MSSSNTAIDLSQAAEQALAYAKQKGMQQAEVSLHQGTGVSITARKQTLETIEKHNDAQIVLSVYKDHKTGSASSADLSLEGLQATVDAAVSIATFTGADECFGLADAHRMATDHSDLELYHPWAASEADLVDMALACEQAALDGGNKITNSEGASVNTYSGSAVYANSHGFLSKENGSQHSISCSVIGEHDGAMQRDYWYDSNRNPERLSKPKLIGERAAERTLARLGARQIKSQTATVMFDPSMAKSLIAHLVGGLKGGAIYKKASYLINHLEQKLMPEFVSISENPHLLGESGSASYDAEGVATPSSRTIVDKGVLKSWVLGSYTARKLGLESTANAGGVRNLRITDTGHSFEDCVQAMHTGLLVTELIGSGINMVTGDYSRGAAGYWVENGVIQYPVEEITIAGNLLDMFKNIVAIANDTDVRGNTHCGSIVVENMTIAGL